MQSEIIVTTLRSTTQMADKVASKDTGWVEPSDSRAIIAIDSKAIIKCACASSCLSSLLFFLLNLLNNLFIVVLANIYNSRLMRLWFVVNYRSVA